MALSRQDCDVSLRTPPGRAAVAVISLRGAGTAAVLAGACGGHRSPTGDSPAPAPDNALRLSHLVADGLTLDEALIASGPGWAELCIHAGEHLARRVLELLVQCGAKAVPPEPSDPQTFCPRHPRWNNAAIGREMLRSLPLVHGGLALASLTAQWSGGVSELARGALESPAALPRAPRSPAELSASLRAAGRALATMRRLLNPVEIVLAGTPNAGKSSLANALVGRPVSIVHHQGGTTRDWVRELAMFEGVPVWLTDTAGLFGAPRDELDERSRSRAIDRIKAADLVLWLSPGAADRPPAWIEPARLVPVASKCDVSAPPPPRAAAGEVPAVAVSAATGHGLDELQHAALRALGLGAVDPQAPMAFTERQADLLAYADEAWDRAKPAHARRALTSLLQGS